MKLNWELCASRKELQALLTDFLLPLLLPASLLALLPFFTSF